jgi:hypothetical protein
MGRFKCCDAIHCNLHLIGIGIRVALRQRSSRLSVIIPRRAVLWKLQYSA